jgi:hypothetical protein
MDPAVVVRALGLPLRLVPAILLVIFAGMLGLFALALAADRRDYARELAHMWTLAACVITTGSRTSLPRAGSERNRPSRKRPADELPSSRT